MYLGKADVNTYDKGVEREYLVSDGTGAYGSSTVVGANTRGEHGLLVVRPHGTTQHTVLVSKIEETLRAHNKKYQLSTNRYPDIIYPDGYRYVQEYQSSPFPSFTFVIHSIFLKKSIFMPTGKSCTVIKYELIASPKEITLDLRPLFAHRSPTDLTTSDKRPDFSSREQGSTVAVKGRGHESAVSFVVDGISCEWSNKPQWFEKIKYERTGTVENPAFDDLWSPGRASVTMSEGDIFYVVISEQPVSYTKDELAALERETSERLMSSIKESGIDAAHTVLRDMVQGSSHLVAEVDGAAPVIYSGFPSAHRRARDTFIALPGLTLATGRKNVARDVLVDWLDHAVKLGHVVPSSLDDESDAKFDDIDAGLWFLYSMQKYSSEAGMDLAKSRYACTKGIIDRYIASDSRLGVVMDPTTKLLRYVGGEKKHWMSGDASGEQIVKRCGYLVEIEALWYSALRFMQELAVAAGDQSSAAEYGEIASAAASSFDAKFWNSSAGYLFDWIDDGACDDSIRPNAILAISLPHPIVSDANKARSILVTCWNELYTTYGLRTLDPHHDKFKGRAEGRIDQMQKAKLRGMAWPWLMGQFVTAYMRCNPDKKDVGWSFLRPFSSHLRRGCLGGVAEYFDGMMPYRPNGDVLSAISQGELLRAMHEDLL